MPTNINCITIIITLESIEKIKAEKMTTKQFEQSCEHLQVERLLFFLNESTQYIKRSWLEITKSCHLSFQKLQKT
jgi:hypothetical protein